MKKPKLSEIRAREQRGFCLQAACIDIPYLLDLVKRMGKGLQYNGGYYVGCKCPECKQTRALLEELKR